MEIEKFIADFADQFDETDLEEFTQDTVYRELDEWSSLTGLAILNMIEKKYGVTLTVSDIKDTSTVGDVYELIISRK